MGTKELNAAYIGEKYGLAAKHVKVVEKLISEGYTPEEINDTLYDYRDFIGKGEYADNGEYETIKAFYEMATPAFDW